jgi:hypothetical protein
MSLQPVEASLIGLFVAQALQWMATPERRSHRLQRANVIALKALSNLNQQASTDAEQRMPLQVSASLRNPSASTCSQ